MLAFPKMIVPAAEHAGIKVPKNLETYDVEEFAYWHVFSLMQLGNSMPHPSVHFENAKTIANIPLQKLKECTYFDLLEAGFQEGRSKP